MIAMPSKSILPTGNPSDVKSRFRSTHPPYPGRDYTGISTEKSNEELARLFLIVPRLVENRAPTQPSTRTAAGIIEKNFSYRSESLKPEASMKLDSKLSLPNP